MKELKEIFPSIKQIYNNFEDIKNVKVDRTGLDLSPGFYKTDVPSNEDLLNEIKNLHRKLYDEINGTDFHKFQDSTEFPHVPDLDYNEVSFNFLYFYVLDINKNENIKSDNINKLNDIFLDIINYDIKTNFKYGFLLNKFFSDNDENNLFSKYYNVNDADKITIQNEMGTISNPGFSTFKYHIELLSKTQDEYLMGSHTNIYKDIFSFNILISISKLIFEFLKEKTTNENLDIMTYKKPTIDNINYFYSLIDYYFKKYIHESVTIITKLNENDNKKDIIDNIKEDNSVIDVFITPKGDDIFNMINPIESFNNSSEFTITILYENAVDIPDSSNSITQQKLDEIVSTIKEDLSLEVIRAEVNKKTYEPEAEAEAEAKSEAESEDESEDESETDSGFFNTINILSIGIGIICLSVLIWFIINKK